MIVLKDITQEQIKSIQNGIGAYLNEGFGEVLINPEFLDKKNLEFKKECKDKNKQNQKEKINREFKDITLQFLVNRHNNSIDKLSLANEVSDFINKNKDIYSQKMNSQWGTIRSLCANNDEDSIECAVCDYISNGVAETKWEGNKKDNLLDAIENSNNKLEFVKLLSIQMPKVKEQKND